MKKMDYLPYGIAFLALLIGAFYDYQISEVLIHEGSFFGMFFERILLIPIQSVVMFTMCMLYVQRKNLLYAALGIVANGYVLTHTFSYWSEINSIAVLFLFLIAFVITFFTILILKRVEPTWIESHLSFFVFFTIVLLMSALVTGIVKEFWGRIRYRDMQEASQFCVWYKPCGMWGNHSFPSGHTCGMTSILCLLQYHQYQYQKPSFVRYGLISAGIVLMAFSRILVGAHFLSDTAMGFVVGYTCYLFARNWFKRRRYL